MLAIVLALVSSAFWGTGDFIGGAISRRLSAVIVVTLGQGFGAVLLVVVVVVAAVPVPSLLLPVAAGVVGLVGLLLFYRGLADGKMALVAPVASCGAVIPVVFAVLTGHSPHLVALVGLGLALAGVVLASTGTARGEGDEESTPGSEPEPATETVARREAGARRAALLAIGAAVCFGVFLLVMAQASQSAPRSVLWVVLGERIGSMAVLALVLVARRNSGPLHGLQRRDLLPIGVGGAMDAAANVAYGYASTTGNLAVVSVLGSLYPLMTVALAQVFYQERVTRLEGAGAALAMLGVVLVGSG